MNVLKNINDLVNGFVWGPLGLSLLFLVGVWMTLVNKGFQITHFKHWIKQTIGAIFKDESVRAHTHKHDKQISQFQSLCTALAATIGTGNIVGVSSAIISGGPGAIFWMWVMSILGMMTNYSENVLGIYYRIKNKKGEWSGGAMYYLANGLGSKKGLKSLGKILAILFSLFCVLASFGIGNIAQVNSISGNLYTAFHIPTFITGILLVFLVGIVVVGGIKRVASVTEKLVPAMAIIYIVGALIVVFYNIQLVPSAFKAIFKGAFGLQSIKGGIIGFTIKQAVVWGFKRGAFSNEAGLGSSVMVHSSSNVKEPVQQGMWGIFEVFADTIVVCTLTALVVLTSGFFDLNTGMQIVEVSASSVVGQAFGNVFGTIGPMFIAVAILMFAFSTVLGWSHYGSKSVEYLLGEKFVFVYQLLFCGMSFFSATMDLTLAWDLSDTFNGLMMIPNLIGVLVCSSTVKQITQNYIDRTFKHKDIKPMYSAYDSIQKQQEEA
ncbi:alanine/glycine:cation symporter family protein [Floccifex sp.]|uniref:alanine/glycine:cation symporter family protein n=1 Tax=Floccifex sp. TaxID=2815810 RepID=UPI0029FED4C6|nr:amino acid carrier protein [Floccifex sp.]MDD7282056.1 alanine/glycine:cation symporter family protein [Erysipelotrichaceae bacterium]MDY2957901.1 alanine/glycine:cation symporter family protein [Floccifex sp.]